MAANDRTRRLREDLELLSALAERSSILVLQPRDNDPPDRYTLTFQGKGLTRDPTTHAEVKLVESHRVELRLPYAYPVSPPDVRWLTPIFHPNISFSGFIRLQDVGISWDPPVPLDAVCERLWDVARLSYYNLESATNYHAKSWIQEQTEWELPVDRRPLAGPSPTASSNVVHYRRAPGGGIELSGSKNDNDIVFISDDTPAPPLPPRQPRPRPRPRPRPQQDDDDVFYIGDDS